MPLAYSRRTASVTGAGADEGTPSERTKAEAWKMLGVCAESPTSSARFVGRQRVMAKLQASDIVMAIRRCSKLELP
jgi:hypothetical protein